MAFLPCPTREELGAYLAGSLPRPRHQAVTDHIDGCKDCQQSLEGLAEFSDSLLSDLRGPVPLDRFENEPERRQALERGKGQDQPQVPETGRFGQDPEATTARPGRPASPRVLSGWIGAYELLEEIARGGMGVVYRARQASLQRVVALKMILASDYADPDALARFQIEAEAVARLQHPNIVQVFECGLSGGKPYLALEYCEGGSLAARLDGTPLPPATAARLVEQLTRAIAAAHRAGIVHRDLKPANVLLVNPSPTHPPQWVGLLGEGVGGRGSAPIPKISDFGLAKKLDDPSGQTRTGSILGTPSYMAPEQALGEGKRVGPPADIYALGAILYELLTGRPPFKATSVLETLEQVRTQEPVPPRVLQPRTPRDLETICLKCLHKEPGQRYPTAEALADDLRAFQDGRPIQARPVGWLEKTVKYARRRPTVATAALTVAASLVAILWLMADHSVRLAHERDLARDQEKAANQARADAESRLVDSLAALGRSAETTGDLPQAALCFAAGARQSAGDPGRAQLLRTRWLAYTAVNPTPWRAVQEQAEERIPYLHLHPTGRWLVSITGTAQWRLWDLVREQLAVWPGPEREVSAAAWSPDGRLLATGSDRGDLHICTVQPAAGLSREWQTISLPHDPDLGPIRFLLFDRDCRRLAVVARRFRVWDLAAGRFLTPELPQPENALILGVAFSPGGTRLATIDDQNALRVFALDQTGDAPRLLFGPKTHFQGKIAICWDQPPVFLGDDRIFRDTQREILLHDLATGKVLRSWPSSAQNGLSVVASPKGQTFVVRLQEWDPEMWQGLQRRLPLRSLRAPRVIRFSPDGSRFLFADKEEFRICNRNGAILSSTIRKEGAPFPIDVAPAAHWFVIRSRSGRNGPVQLWRAAGGAPLLAQLAEPEVPGECFIHSADRARVVEVSERNGRWQLRAHDTKTGQPIGVPILVARKPFAGAVSPDYRTLFLGTKEDRGGELSAWDLASGQPTFPAEKLPYVPMVIQCSPDGRRIVLVTRFPQLQVRDAVTGAIITWQDLGPSEEEAWPAEHIRFSHDGRSFLTYGFQDGARLWATADGASLGALAPGQMVKDAHFSPDDRLLLIASRTVGGSEVTIWEIASGRPAVEPLPFSDRLFHARFDPSGEQVAVARRDRRVVVWSWREGARAITTLGHAAEVTDAAWSPDGRWLATAAGGFARLWDVQSGNPLTPEWWLLDPGQQVPPYAHHIEFTSDGRGLLVLTRGRHVSLFDLSSLCDPAVPELDADDLVLLAEINAGLRVQPGGSVDPLTSAEWLERWRRFRHRHPEYHSFDP